MICLLGLTNSINLKKEWIFVRQIIILFLTYFLFSWDIIENVGLSFCRTQSCILRIKLKKIVSNIVYLFNSFNAKIISKFFQDLFSQKRKSYLKIVCLIISTYFESSLSWLYHVLSVLCFTLFWLILYNTRHQRFFYRFFL